MSEPVTRTYTQHIDASADEVFPLLCPRREAEWLDGWEKRCEIVHSKSGFAEEGCVFRTALPGEPETIWMVVRHDPRARVVEFARVTAGLVATRLHIRVDDAAPASLVQIAYTHTPISGDGAAYIAREFGDDAFRRSMEWWERSMNHWLRSGEMLRAQS